MLRRNKSAALWFAILMIVILVALDQISKIIATSLLREQSDLIIIPGVLQLHYLENTGAAFSTLTGKTWVFLILTPVICIILVYFLLRMAGKVRLFPLFLLDAMLLSGAIGNYLDRLHYRYVIDFIYVSLIDFPVFNVADIYVTVSVFLLFILIVFVYKDEDFTGIFGGKK